MKIDISKYNECYIVAGGPSLKDFDWSLLDGKFCIAINNSYKVLPSAQIVYFTDNDWWKQHKDQLKHFKGIKCKGSLPGHQLNLPGHIEEFTLTGATYFDMTPGNLRHGHNSTYAALNLAVQLGFKKVYLLGVDMKWGRRGDKSTSHWHNQHKRLDPEHVYRKMMECYQTALDPLKKNNVEVFNVSPKSALTVFPKLSFAEVFGEKYIAPPPEPEPEPEPQLLGDVVEKTITAVGGKTIAKTIQRVTKKPCNCAKRKQALNNFHKKLSKYVAPYKIEKVLPPPIKPGLMPTSKPRLPPKRKV